jgi:elongation factor P--beta-lysine ligase
MNEQDKIIWAVFRDDTKGYLHHDEYMMICNYHAKYKDHELILPCKCDPAVIQSYINDLNQIFENGK